ncbi:MAG: ATP-binding protein [Pseudomonadota bacterium]
MRWRGSLFLRLMLAWCCALLVGHLINAGVSYLHVLDYQVTRTSYYLAKDLAVLVPMVEAAAPPERAAWLGRMERSAYSFTLDQGAPALAPRTADASRYLKALGDELGPKHPVTLVRSESGDYLRLQVALADGARLTARVRDLPPQVSMAGGFVFLAQMLAVIGISWFAVRQATRPLQRLAEQAEVLGVSMQCEPIAEDGPAEVARAAAAFNAMGRRIKEHLAERVRILAAISHDLQTPITRMRLRAELMDDAQLRAKFESDLGAMQALVEEGIAYARSVDRTAEAACAVDVSALFDSVVGDYADGGYQVDLVCPPELVLHTRPHTLRRVVVNLADNALKFAQEVQIEVSRPAPDRVAVCVRDRGPGIDPAQLEAVCQPFYRIDSSRNRSTGGTGLGLAIAQQLSLALGGTLMLANREGGGLEARVEFAC